MKAPSILVVGETPSLGRSVTDLLDSWSLPVEYVEDPGGKAPLENFAGRHPVVVVACNSYFCETGRRWARGELPKVALVVVGSRDPLVLADRRICSMPLPLEVRSFLDIVRGLLVAGTASLGLGAPVPSGPPSRGGPHRLGAT